MKVTKISIVIPVYNEEQTILMVLDRIAAVNLGTVEKEVIIVDDGSSDKTRTILRKLKKESTHKIHFHKKNMGKGYALRTGFSFATGDVIVVQDSDLEYHPKDIKHLLAAYKKNKAQVVYGSRMLGHKKIKHGGLQFYYGGRLINILTNLLYNTSITDEATGYKMFDTNLLQSIPLKCQRFEFCPEVTAKIAKRRIKIHEVPISYTGLYFFETVS